MSVSHCFTKLTSASPVNFCFVAFALQVWFGGRRSADVPSAKYKGKSERFHSIFPSIGKL